MNNIFKYIKNLFSQLEFIPSTFTLGSFETDKAALKSDWEAIGQDFKKIIR